MMTQVTADEVGDLLRGRMGLIVGPGLTSSPTLFTDLAQELAREFNVSEEGTSFDVAARAVAHTEDSDVVRDFVRKFHDKQKPTGMLAQFAKGRWAAVVSASLDLNLETRLQQESERQALRRPVTTVNDFLQIIPPRTLPSWKLLGSHTRDDFTYSNVQYLKRRPTWRHGARSFAERVRGNPVLCVGMATCPWILHDLLSEMIADQATTLSTLLLLADDPLINDTTLHQLLHARTRIITVTGGIAEFVRSITLAEKVSYGPKLPFREESESQFTPLLEFDDFVSVVNTHIEPTIQKTETNRLLDALFSPSSMRWDPYAYELDLQRGASGQLTATIKRQFEDVTKDVSLCSLIGGAASGKTTVLKRVAFDLAKEGHLVLWFRQILRSGTSALLSAVFKSISTIGCKHVVAVVDDPMAFGSVAPSDIASAARSNGIHLVVITGVRTSDWSVSDRSHIVGSLPVVAEEDLPDNLSEMEWKALPSYLVKLGIASDLEQAQQSLNAAASRSARDTLSTLYFLLAATKTAIASSVRGEYFRLGDIAGLRKAVINQTNRDPQTLKDAYEMVAVSDKYRAPLPIEVLVSALGVGYDTWLSAISPDGSAWGLLYSEDSEEGDTVCYRTRNAVVTQLIVEAVNGGAFGHSGELAVLTRLLNACSGRGSPVYRDFCVKVLVPHQGIDHLEFSEGMNLYNTAISALPYPDKTLAHHNSLWVKNKGHDPIKAEAMLTSALNTPQYPYAIQQESQEHIYTSLAAAALDTIDAGNRNVDDGKQVVMDYLEKARKKHSFDARPVHVQANLMIRLAKKIDDTKGSDFFTLINRAVADLDRTLLVLKNPVMEKRQRFEDVRMLEQAREQVLLAITSLDELKEQANELWASHNSQEGFVLVARKMYQMALESNRGKHFRLADDYCIRSLRLIDEAGLSPSIALLEVTLHNYYSWQVLRGLFSVSDQSADWQRIRELVEPILRGTDTAEDPFYRFIYGLTLSHQGQWPEASAVFEQNRAAGMPSELLWSPRGYLLDDNGKPRLVQGTIRQSDDRLFFHAEDLGTDFYTRKGSRLGKADEVTHAYIEFSFGAARAVEPSAIS